MSPTEVSVIALDYFRRVSVVRTMMDRPSDDDNAHFFPRRRSNKRLDRRLPSDDAHAHMTRNLRRRRRHLQSIDCTISSFGE